MTRELLVIIGAAVGAHARYLTDRWLQPTHGSGFPCGTFTVNVVASFVLGLVTGPAAAPCEPEIAVWSAPDSAGALDLVHPRPRDGPPRRGTGWAQAAFNIVASVLAGLGAAGLGIAVAEGIAL